MVFVLALGAALANALTSIFQRMGVEKAPQSATLRLSLIVHALHKKIWLLGFALMIVSFLLQATALHLGRLSQVQPVLTTELVFLVAVLATWFGFTVGRREWLGSLAVTAGLHRLLFFAHPEYGMQTPPLWEWLIAGGACTVGIGVAHRAGAGPAWWRAAMFGTGAAISFAFTSACTKAVADFAAHDVASLYRHWQTYALAFFGAQASGRSLRPENCAVAVPRWLNSARNTSPGSTETIRCTARAARRRLRAGTRRRARACSPARRRTGPGCRARPRRRRCRPARRAGSPPRRLVTVGRGPGRADRLDLLAAGGVLVVMVPMGPRRWGPAVRGVGDPPELPGR